MREFEEYLPKGYSNWWQYHLAQERKRVWKDRLATVAIVVALVVAYWAMALLEAYC